MNNISLIGRIANDLELKTTTNDNYFINFTIAVDRKYKDKDGEKQTDFINIVAWKNLADTISKYFSKGKLIGINGTLQANSYVDKQGEKKYNYEVLAENITFCGENKN